MSKNAKANMATIVLTAALWVAAGPMAASVAMADEPATVASPTKLRSGLTPTAQLLQLMDRDNNGKVSKEEFMRFMEAEFDFADKDKNGELDPKELKQLQFSVSHPAHGPGR
jgi:hypothetical protein